MLSYENEDQEEEIGGFRETKRGVDAYAKTFSYDPGRSQKGFPTIEDAKTFVESFSPWELFEGTQGLTVEPEVRPALDSPTPAASSASEQSAEIATPEPQPESALPEPEPEPAQPESVAPDPQPESVVPELQQKKSWWEFWKQG